uniref:Uncharacterized protein n=1 Tax=Arundo donax TaxID=35708 RepID=A0A0A9AHP7_ARUDO
MRFSSFRQLALPISHAITRAKCFQ